MNRKTAVTHTEDFPMVSQVVEFVLELEKLKGVLRKTRPVGLDRYENSAEHSWQIAVFAASLAPFAPEGIDINRVVGMLLMHDIGEIDAGDTIFYAEEGLAQRKLAERAAALRIFQLLPLPQRTQFMNLWQEFEDNCSAEARFAQAVDRAMPVLLNLTNNGQSWRENGISYEQVISRVGPLVRAGCPELWSYLEARLEAEYEAGWFGMRPEQVV